MPRCVGLSTGQCPTSKCDNSVKFGYGELMLCAQCDTARQLEFASLQAVCNSSTTEKLVDTTVYASECCELLCFMQQKMNVMVFDHIIEVCLNFYSSDEIKKAHSVTVKFAKHRLPLHKGAGKDRKILIDLLKVCLDPNVKLPMFYAIQIGRLPPVGIDHIDLSAILQELVMLREEVKSVVQLRTDLSELRSCLQALSLHKDGCVSDTVVLPSQQLKTNLLVEDVYAKDISAATAAQADEINVNVTSAAQVLKKAIHSGNMQSQQVRRHKAVVGVKTGSAIRVVPSRKTVDVFISRLSHDTTNSEVTDCLCT